MLPHFPDASPTFAEACRSLLERFPQVTDRYQGGITRISRGYNTSITCVLPRYQSKSDALRSVLLAMEPVGAAATLNAVVTSLVQKLGLELPLPTLFHIGFEKSIFFPVMAVAFGD